MLSIAMLSTPENVDNVKGGELGSSQGYRVGRYRVLLEVDFYNFLHFVITTVRENTYVCTCAHTYAITL